MEVMPSLDNLSLLPDLLLHKIFQYLSVQDLIALASCNLQLRSACNKNSLWRRLCCLKAWEHFGNTTALSEENAYQCVDETLCRQLGAGDGHEQVSFYRDATLTAGDGQLEDKHQLRSASNRGSLWRRLCCLTCLKVWEHFGNTTALSEQNAYQCVDETLCRQQGAGDGHERVSFCRDATLTAGDSQLEDKGAGDGHELESFYKDVTPTAGDSQLEDKGAGDGHEQVSFYRDATLTAGDSQLKDNCKWKEVYIMGHHFENNWANGRFHATTFTTTGLNLHLYHDVCDIDGNWFVGYTSFGNIEVWDIKMASRKHVIRVSICFGDCMKIKNGIIVVGCYYWLIRTFSAETGEALWVMKVHSISNEHPSHYMSIFLDGEVVVSGVARGSPFCYEHVGVWSINDGELRHVLVVSSSIFEDVQLKQLTYRDKTVAGAFSDNYIRLWDARNGCCLQCLECPTITPRRRLVQLGNGLVVCSNETNVIVWSQQSGKYTQSWTLCAPERPEDYEGIRIFQVAIMSGLLVVHYRGGRASPGALSRDCIRAYNTRGQMLHERYFKINSEVFVSDTKCCIGKSRDCYHILKATESGLVPFARFQGHDVSRMLWIDDTRLLWRDNRYAINISYFW